MDIPREFLEPENISAMAGGILSVTMIVIPGLNTRWDRLAGETKQAIMAGLSVLAALGVVFYTCSQPSSTLPLGVCVGGVNWWTVGQAMVFAIVGNAGVYQSVSRLRDWFKPKGHESSEARPASDIPPRASYPPSHSSPTTPSTSTPTEYADRPTRKI